MRSSLLVLLLMLAPVTLAHTGSNSFLYWSPEQGNGRVDIAVADLADWLAVEGDITWQQVTGQAAQLEARVGEGITLATSDGSICGVDVTLAGVTRYQAVNHVAFALSTPCAAPVSLRYDLLFEQDLLHRVLVTVGEGESAIYGVLSPASNTVVLSHSSDSLGAFAAFTWQGMVHLWVGYDHLLFLLTLMLAVLATGSRTARPARDYLLDTLAVVTAFTVAHSITLVLAATGTVRLPGSLVEVVIALSITFAAIQVRWPLVKLHPWVLAFAFGLIHGFGFANVLADLVQGDTLPWLPLAGFNIGLELAQVVVVLVLMPVLFLCMRHAAWHRWGQPSAVMAVAITGLWWAYERMPVLF